MFFWFNLGKESSSKLSNNLLLLLLVLVILIVAAAVAVVVTISCYKRRRQRSLKPPTLQCSNSLGDGNDYDSPPKASEGSTPQSNENKNSGFGGMMGIAVPVLLPLEHRRKPSVSVPRGTTERQFDEQYTSMPEPNVSRPRMYRKPSVSAPRSDTEPRHGRKPSMTLPSGVVKPERYPKPIVSVPSSTSVPKSDRKSKQTGPLYYCKASLSVPSSDIEP